MQKWIGPAAYGKIPKEKTLHGSPMINSFEECKRDFSGTQDNNMVTLPKECGIEDDESRNIDEKVLTMTP